MRIATLTLRESLPLAMVYYSGAWLLGEIQHRTPSGYIVFVRRAGLAAHFLADQVLPMGS